MENKNILQKSGFDTKIKHIDPLKIDTSVEMPGYNKDVLDDRISVTNRYLDYVLISGSTSITGKAVGTIIDYNIIPLSSFVEKTGNLNWKITETGGLEIPVSGSYIMTFLQIFIMHSNTSGKTVTDIINQYGLSALIPSVTYSAKEGDTRIPVQYDALPFYSGVSSRNMTINAKLEKGNVLYVCADHRWEDVTFPINGGIYITKIS